MPCLPPDLHPHLGVARGASTYREYLEICPARRWLPGLAPASKQALRCSLAHACCAFGANLDWLARKHGGRINGG